MKQQRTLRKRQREQITEAETATPLGVHGLLVEIRRLLGSIFTVVKVVLFAAFVLIVVSVALQLQVSSRNDDIHATKVTAGEAKQAASDAKQAVEDAIAQTRSGQTLDPAAINTALQSIARIEQYLCDGPCPDTGGK